MSLTRTSGLLVGLWLTAVCPALSAVQSGALATEYSKPVFEPSELVKPGVTLHRTTLRGNQLWVYLPSPLPELLPCIFIAPAGSRGYHGMRIVEGDMPEHLPYVEAGYAVVCYGVSGPMPDSEDPTWDDAYSAAEAFKRARAGVSNGKAAMNWALKRIPGIDPDRLVSVGHSSAGTLSLQLAQRDSRISACVAFMPDANSSKGLSSDFLAKLEAGVKGYTSFAKRMDPHEHAKKLKCPTYLLAAKDDEYFYRQVVEFAKKLKTTNEQVEITIIDKGGHYAPMISHGIPGAIRWIENVYSETNQDAPK